MDNLEQLNKTIKSEANKILYDHGLDTVLSKYGNPVLWGSYVLDLMTWRDLDIYLETNEITEQSFFQLGHDISQCLKPYRMHYRNEFIGKTPGNPEGLYWGIYVNVPEIADEWKIDVWVLNTTRLLQHQREFNALKESINAENSRIILEIKYHFHKHPEYRRGFASMDIYQAIIKDNIRSVEEFTGWLREHKKIE
ncbi:hypothetical protein ACFLYN_04005 [Chloroflexota bacterium]